MSSPTQRTLVLLRKEGWTAQVVEKWVPQARKRIDLFGIVDIFAINVDGTLGVQTTSSSNISKHLTKALQCPHLKTWLMAGLCFEIWGWSLKGKKGKRKTYQRRRIVFELTEDGSITHSEVSKDG